MYITIYLLVVESQTILGHCQGAAEWHRWCFMERGGGRLAWLWRWQIGGKACFLPIKLGAALHRELWSQELAETWSARSGLPQSKWDYWLSRWVFVSLTLIAFIYNACYRHFTPQESVYTFPKVLINYNYHNAPHGQKFELLAARQLVAATVDFFFN